MTELSKKKLPFLLLIVLLLILTSLFAAACSRANASGGGFDPEQGLVVSGTVESEEVDLNTKIPGKVARIYVEEGQEVKAGDLIAEIDSTQLQAKKAQVEAQVKMAKEAIELQKKITDANVEQASGIFQAAQAQLNKAQEGARSQEIEQAKAYYEMMEKTYARVLKLYEKGAIPAQKKDEVETQLKVAKEQYSMAVEGARQEDVEAAQGLANQAAGALSAANASKLQVELARLSYDAPQVRSELALKKRGEQPGFRGAGAYEQSMYHDIRGRMAKIRAELREVEAMGEGRRRRRREMGFDLIALAGYTNAGKSTLLNTLTGSGVVALDQPFTTLSPTTRALEINSRRALLTDTVGFIDDLPHFLIKAFHSTLSEIAQADLVLLVADLSDPLELLRRKLVASHKALWDCQVTAPMITVLNKVDRLDGLDARMKVDQIVDLAPNPVMVSAHSSQGLERLKELIHQSLPPLEEYQIRLPYNSRSFGELSRLYRTCELLNVRYEEELILSLRGRAEDVARMRKTGDDEPAE